MSHFFWTACTHVLLLAHQTVYHIDQRCGRGDAEELQHVDHAPDACDEEDVDHLPFAGPIISDGRVGRGGAFETGLWVLASNAKRADGCRGLHNTS